MYKPIQKNIIIVIYIFLYLILTSLSIGVFFLFKPYTYIENNTSYVICNDGSRFEIGPNSIFAFENTFDSFNDRKARVLCEYKIIRDYGNTFKTPNDVNYQLHPIYGKESSWTNALLAASLFFVIGFIPIELMLGKKIESEFNIWRKVSKLLVFLIS